MKQARYKKSGEVVAIKMLKKSHIIKMKQISHVTNERAILMTCEHPFIVNLLSTFKDATRLYMVMEYVPGGEFFRYLRTKRFLKEDQAKFYAAQVVLVLQYLHSKNVVHRDLKPEVCGCGSACVCICLHEVWCMSDW